MNGPRSRALKRFGALSYGLQTCYVNSTDSSLGASPYVVIGSRCMLVRYQVLSEVLYIYEVLFYLPESRVMFSRHYPETKSRRGCLEQLKTLNTFGNCMLGPARW